MNQVFLIRHGATAGNLEHRYVGRTDEPLCSIGRAQILGLKNTVPLPEKLFVSPLRRTVETAELLFPGVSKQLLPELRETDFGEFEGKTGGELWETDSRYRLWVDGGCLGQIPGGEHPQQATERCVKGFLSAMQTVLPGETAAFVIHGGGIMAICSALAKPERSYYDWKCSNGEVLSFSWDGTFLWKN